jgi:adenylosuccinate synthase
LKKKTYTPDMKNLILIGAQWGDEGKGKITDLLSEKSDIVVRYQGGNNAGHTIIVKDKKIVLHLVPSGILHNHTVSLVAHGVVVDPAALKEEIEKLIATDIKVSPKNLKVSFNSPVITSYHKIMDQAREQMEDKRIGTTGRGIGPTYEDKVARRGLKLADLLNREQLKEKLALLLREKEVLFKDLYKVDYPTILEEADRLFELGKFVAPYLCDSFSFLCDAYEKNKKVLFEGAQGAMLDIDYGTYPFVTSSNTSWGGVFTGAGGVNRIDEVLGVAKAYTTRVGSGPFPSEVGGDLGEKIQNIGKEFGATTGRRRRCGWVDLPLLKYAIKMSNITSIALTKVDVLTEIEELKICVGYSYEGKEIDIAYPGIDLSKVTPKFVDMDRFDWVQNKNGLHPNLEKYVSFLEKQLKTPIGLLAFGPERSEIIFRKEYF